MDDGTKDAFPASLDDRIRFSLKFFKSKGWSDNQSAGIVANLVAESNLLPDATGDNGKASGIAQWHPSRQDAFMLKNKKPLIGSSLNDQLEFVNYELTAGLEKGAGKKLQQAVTASDAGATVSKYYERPAEKEAEANSRGQRATSIYNQFLSEKKGAKSPGT